MFNVLTNLNRGLKKMTEETLPIVDWPALRPETLEVASLADEIRIDRLCAAMLRTFCSELTAQQAATAEQIGRLCHGADYFLREFVIADRRLNLLQVTGHQVRQFAGHWYMIRNLEPNMTDLDRILAGIAAFYAYLADQALIRRQQADGIAAACADRAWYQQRIESFRALAGDGYLAWRDEVPL